MNLDSALQTFIAESRELLEAMEQALLAVEQAGDKSDMINSIFRAAHTIKGSAGLFSLDHVVAFTHVVESVLDRVRDGEIAIEGQLVALMLECCDHIGLQVTGLESGLTAGSESLTARGEPLIVQLSQYLEGQPAPAASAAEDDTASSAAGSCGAWQITVQFGRDVLRNGMDPLSFLHYLRTLGTITGIRTLADALPAAAGMDPESCYIGLDIAFASTAGLAEIEGVFEFVRGDCELSIVPVPDAAPPPEPAAALPAALARSGAAEQPKARPQERQSIRVDAERLDRLINLVGELIIASASANLAARRSQVAELQESTSVVSALVEEMRDSALQLRMVKIGATFNRFQRVVHDVARETGKDIRLEVSGEDAELDKTVVEKIADPLTHLVRNAIDHGIEPAEVRAARGKPATGTVRLNAYHDSGSIVIEVSDDGGGLKRDRILAKAVERGLVEAGRELADRDIFNLIFEPGFSTADQVTNLSGRGVGMDVVKRNIVALRGSVDIASEEGVGTSVTVRMPLTLAIINGFLSGVGKSTFVVPLDMVEECVEFNAEPGLDYANLRGTVLPFVSLRELFGIGGAPAARQNIVVIRYGARKAGLVVDTLLGEFQTVIKPLGKIFSAVKCISGSSILGSGDVALILDIPALFNYIENKSARQLAA